MGVPSVAAQPEESQIEHRVPFKVYYEDTDALGIVYYANYFKFLERGRAEYLESGGRSVADWNAAGYLFVVHAVSAKFKKPAALGDIIEIVTSFRHASPFRGVFDQRVERAGEVLLTATIDIACLDSGQNLRRLPTSLTA
ncbi:MAG: YbgC/FadM family acyl-CoA thioesterase [Dermatophilus congolensis]|nr:YbgC/FadM family acyl-CoA thioesterase [Dermatophilus congolensis]